MFLFCFIYENVAPHGTCFQLAGALAEEGCSLDQIVSKVTEVLKGIGESLLHSRKARYKYWDAFHNKVCRCVCVFQGRSG